jgi:hypothetical protein
MPGPLWRGEGNLPQKRRGGEMRREETTGSRGREWRDNVQRRVNCVAEEAVTARYLD